METAKPLIEKARTEDGYISYELVQSKTDENKLAFIEAWRDQAALDVHCGTEHFKTTLPKLAGLCAAPPAIEVYHKLI